MKQRESKKARQKRRGRLSSICLEEREEGQKVRSLLCMHSFHAACIDPWLRMSTKCPTCQFVVQL
jgi:hypothetical protein